jgi:hypothetical protein
MNKGRFPEWFPVERFAEISLRLAEKREPAMYGNELRMMLTSILFDEEQASEALKDAKHVYNLSLKLLREAKSKATPLDKIFNLRSAGHQRWSTG